jgi:hypothetical protein
LRFRPYGQDVEFFAVYCRENGGVYLVPIADLPGQKRAYLRVDPPRNSQRKRIRMAGPYEIGRIPLATAELGVRAGGSGSSA